MDYRKIAAAGMSLAIILGTSTGAFAAPPSPPEGRSGESPAVSASQTADRRASGGTEASSHGRSDSTQHHHSGRQDNGEHLGAKVDSSEEKTAQSSGSSERPGEKPNQKPDRKPDKPLSSGENTGNASKQDKPGRHASDSKGSESGIGKDGQGTANGEQDAKPNKKPGGSGNANLTYDSANTVTTDVDGSSYHSSGDSENAVLVDGKQVTLTGITVSKTGGASGDNADFYGVNAAVLANNGAALTIENAEITSSGAHANGVFSYGKNTSVEISDSVITTSGNNSGGLMTTGGAKMVANGLTVKTTGNSSAAIRSDRGGGTVTVNGGTYTSSGVGSPAIYSTADITVNGAELVSTASEGVVVEGKNSVTLNGVTLTDTNTRHAGKSSTDKNIFLYQSMSGDASIGTAVFEANNSTITTNRGDTFYVTNTTAEIRLSNNQLVNNGDGDLLRAEAAAWGTSGKNGGNVSMILSNQKASGDVVADQFSTVSLALKDGSAYEGAVNTAGSAGKAEVTLDAGSTWTLTGDSRVESISGDLSGLNLNGHTLYVNGTVYSG